jgi:hypothetical protein
MKNVEFSVPIIGGLVSVTESVTPSKKITANFTPLKVFLKKDLRETFWNKDFIEEHYLVFNAP